GAATTWAGSCSQAIEIRASAIAAVYGDGPPGSQPSIRPPAQAPCSTAALAPAPAAPTTWIRSPGTIRRAGRAGSRPEPGVAVPVIPCGLVGSSPGPPSRAEAHRAL